MRGTGLLGLVLLVLFCGCSGSSSDEASDYGGQPPHEAMELFFPGTIASDHREHCVPLLSPDGRELYFSRQVDGRHDIHVAVRTETGWSEPVPVSFSSDALDDGPAFTPDGRRMYFGSRRPRQPGGSPRNDTDLWYVDRTDSGWGQPVCLPAPVNTDASESFPTLTTDGVLYFHSSRPGGQGTDIYRAEPDGDGFALPVLLPAPVNSASMDAAPSISRDGDTLLLTRYDPPDFSTMRLMLLRRDREGAWGWIADVTDKLGLGRSDLIMGRLSADQRILLTLSDADVRWADARVLFDPDVQAPVQPDAAGLERLLREHDPAVALAQFAELIAADGDTLRVGEAVLNRLGYRLLEQGRPEAGAAVLAFVTDHWPDSWNAWDSLGEARLYLDDRDGAIAAYERSLALNPEHDGARRQLDTIDIALYEHRHETRELYRYQAGEQTGLKGPYLGQTPPGTEPEVFAPGLISTRGGFEFSCAFSPDGREFYFNRGFNISVCRLEADGWTAPRRAEFNNQSLNHEAHITHDGRRLFWGCRRARTPDGEAGYGIWFMERDNDGWGEPQYHGQGMYVTTASNLNLYLTDIEDLVGGGLARQPWLGDGYGELERLPEIVNEYPAAHPCIAPDESWLMFDARRPDVLGGEGDDDFYISFRDGETWSAPVHLTGGISDPGSNMCAYISPDGKYLFFHGRRDIYWVSATVLEQYRP